MKKIGLVFIFAVLLNVSFIQRSGWAQSEVVPKAVPETNPAKITASYQKKAVEFYDLMNERMSYKDSKKIEDKELAKVFAPYFSEEDLVSLISIYQAEVIGKFTKNIGAVYLALDNLRYKDSYGSYDQPKNKKGKKKKQSDPYAYGDDYYNSPEYKNRYCQEDLDRAVDGVTKGINRFRRASGTGAYPAKLDNAEDGAADYENRMFGYLGYGMEKGWSKKENTYQYKCGKVSKTFTYNPTDGSFK